MFRSFIKFMVVCGKIFWFERSPTFWRWPLRFRCDRSAYVYLAYNRCYRCFKYLDWKRCSEFYIYIAYLLLPFEHVCARVDNVLLRGLLPFANTFSVTLSVLVILWYFYSAGIICEPYIQFHTYIYQCEVSCSRANQLSSIREKNADQTRWVYTRLKQAPPHRSSGRCGCVRHAHMHTPASLCAPRSAPPSAQWSAARGSRLTNS